MSRSQIIEIPSGYFNVVNDAAIGMFTAPTMGTGQSPFRGQLGAWFEASPEQIRYDPSVGIVLGGRFQYVKLHEDADTPVIGQAVFWSDESDPTDEGYFTVETDETSASTDAAVQKAGIILSADVDPGNYTLIQTMGQVYAKFRAVLTSAGVAGSSVYTAGVGGADLGLMDVVSDGDAVLFSDAALLLARYLGTAIEAPVGGALKLVNLNFGIVRQ